MFSISVHVRQGLRVWASFREDVVSSVGRACFKALADWHVNVVVKQAMQQ